MRSYCKAYHLRDLRAFAAWREPTGKHLPPLTADSIVYLADDFTVVASPIQQDQPLFSDVTPQWQAFCTETLHFAIPDDVRAIAATAGQGTPTGS